MSVAVEMKTLKKEFDQVTTIDSLTFKLPTNSTEVEVYDDNVHFDSFTYCYESRSLFTFKKACNEWLNEQ